MSRTPTTHHLNKGLAGWWLSQSDERDVGDWYDITHWRWKVSKNGSPYLRDQRDRKGALGRTHRSSDNNNYRSAASGRESRGPLNILDSQMSVMLWANLDNDTTIDQMVNKTTSGFTGSGYAIHTGNTIGVPQFRLILTSAGAVDISATGFTWGGLWHHFMGTYDGANMRWYIDGIEDAGSPSAQADTIVSSATSRFCIGTQPSGGINSFVGAIDDVRVWNRPLSAAEVKAVYLDSMQGYPKTLRDIHNNVLAFPPVAAAGGGAQRLVNGGLIR